MEHIFGYGDIIDFCGDKFMVLMNYGHCGRVQEYFDSGNVGCIIDPFYWQVGKDKATLLEPHGF